jgi:hypothetical protein
VGVTKIMKKPFAINIYRFSYHIIRQRQIGGADRRHATKHDSQVLVDQGSQERGENLLDLLLCATSRARREPMLAPSIFAASTVLIRIGDFEQKQPL